MHCHGRVGRSLCVEQLEVKCGCASRRSKCEGHDDAVRVLAVAGGKVFSGSYDGSIGVW